MRVFDAIGSGLSACVRSWIKACARLAICVVYFVCDGVVVSCGGGEFARGAVDPGRVPAGSIGRWRCWQDGVWVRNAWVEKLPFVLVSVAFVVVAIAAAEAIAGRGGAEQSIGKHYAGLLWDLVLFMEDVTPVEPDRGVPHACAD